MKKNSFAAFNTDVQKNGGYQYTTNAPLSSQFANQRLTQATIESADFYKKRVVDFGCGDGVYTSLIWKMGQPGYLLGIDIAEDAIQLATRKYGKPNKLEFKTVNLEQPPKWFRQEQFDIGVARGLVHHFDHPELFFKHALKNVSEVILLEPNGWNPILKVIEKTSTYHIEHHEKSYTSWQLRKWLEQAGFTITKEKYIGLVPFFCPSWMASILKKIEPIIEQFPLARRFCCAVVMLKARR